jgi:tetratricopeptide (TPR) repeat protein
MRSILFFITLNLFLTPHISGQQSKLIDSLENLLKKKELSDTTKVLTIAELALEYAKTSPEKSLSLAEDAFLKSEVLHYDKGKGRAYFAQGYYYYWQNNYEKAFYFLEKAIFHAKKSKDERTLAPSYFKIGTIYLEQGKNDNALDYLFRSLLIYEIGKDKKGMARVLISLGLTYDNLGQFNKSVEYYFKALKNYEDVNDNQGVANALNNIGGVYRAQGDFERALDQYLESVKIKTKIKDKGGLATTFLNIGTIYSERGINDRALDYFLKALVIREEMKDTIQIANAYNNIASIYSDQKNYEKSLEFHFKALKLLESVNKESDIADSYNYVGNIYIHQKKYDSALFFLNKSWKKQEKIGEKLNEISSLESLGALFLQLQQFDSAKIYLIEGLKIAQETALNPQIGSLKASLANYYNTQNDFKTAYQFASEALEIAKKVGSVNLILKSSEQLFVAATQLGFFKEALESHRLFKTMEDSMQNIEVRKKTYSKEFEYKDEKRRLEQEKIEIEHQKEIANQKLVTYASFGISLLVSVFLVLIIRSYREKKQTMKLVHQKNEELNQTLTIVNQQKEEIKQTLEMVNHQKRELEDKKVEIETKNDKITSSINYAFRIQHAILPLEDELRNYFNDFFVFYLPCEIVSGDFYWFANKEDKVIIASIDCTGHGVPGALMTMIANNILNQIVHDLEIHRPDKVLNLIPIYLQRTLHRYSEGQVKDGMDIAMVALTKSDDPNSPLKYKTLEYAGAMNPLYYTQSEEMNEVKATKMPIGGRLDGSYTIDFKLFSMEINQPTTFYLCSDGFQDQFGGGQARKFMTKRLKTLLQDISYKEMSNQKKELETAFYQWKGNYDQIDDVMVLGFKI